MEYLVDFTILLTALKNSALQIGIGIAVVWVIGSLIIVLFNKRNIGSALVSLVLSFGVLAFLLNFNIAYPAVTKILTTAFGG